MSNFKNLIQTSNQKVMNKVTKITSDNTLAEKIANASMILGIKSDDNINQYSKVVRMPFSLPVSDVNLLNSHIERFIKLGKAVNKSEIIRLGLKLVELADDDHILNSLELIPKLKMGRKKP